MPAKMIVDRRKTARNLGKAVRELTAEAAPSLVERLTPSLREGETVPDVLFLFELVARHLETTGEMVTAKHETLQEQRERAAVARRRRDLSANEVRDTLVRLRRVADGAFGEQAANELFGFDGVTGKGPEDLLLRAKRVLARLSGGNFDQAFRALAGVELETSALVAGLEGPTSELEAALEELSQGLSQSSNQAVGKRESLEDFDRLHQCTARLVQDLLKLADLPGLAASVKLAHHKVRTAVTEAPGDPVT